MIRNSAALAGQRVLLLVIGVLYAVVVPRLMGPAEYGRFTLLLSIMTWFYILSDLGMPQSLSRLVTERLVTGSRESNMDLLGGALAVRGVSGLFCAAAFVCAVAFFLPDMPRAVILFFAATLSINALVEPFFSWQLGCNRAERWGFHFLLRRFFYLLLVPAGFVAAGLWGAGAGLVIGEFMVLALGVFWTRENFDPARVRLRAGVLSPLLRMGLVFYAGNLISGTYRYSGETLVQWVTHDYVDVGYFGLSMGVYTAAEAGLIQLLAAATPFLSQLHAGGRMDEIAGWFSRLLGLITALAMLAAIAAWYLAETVAPRVFGESFRPAVQNLYPVGFALVASAGHAAAVMMSIVLKRPRIYLVSAAVRLVVFVGVGVLLVRHWGSFGACLALALAPAASGLVALAQVSAQQKFSLHRWLIALALAAPFFFLRGLGPDVMMFFVASSGYVLALFATRVITVHEVVGVCRAIIPDTTRRNQI